MRIGYALLFQFSEYLINLSYFFLSPIFQGKKGVQIVERRNEKMHTKKIIMKYLPKNMWLCEEKNCGSIVYLNGGS